MLEQSEKPVISVRKLRKVYVMGQERVIALRNINLDIVRGEVCCIFGTSGSGKSTLLNQLAGLEKPTHGVVRIGGVPISSLNENELAAFRQKHIGFVFQSFNLIPQLSVLENIEVPLFYQGWREEESRLRSRELAKLVGLEHRMDHRPAELSGGQRQRVAIARALANDPAMLFADEPTGNLDHATGLEIMRVLDDLAAQGRSIILVTHERAIAEHAGRILWLQDGAIAKDERR